MPLEDFPLTLSSCLGCCHHPTQCRCPCERVHGSSHSLAPQAELSAFTSLASMPRGHPFCGFPPSADRGPRTFKSLLWWPTLPVSLLSLPSAQDFCSLTDCRSLLPGQFHFLPTKWVPFRFTPFSVQLDPTWVSSAIFLTASSIF